MNADTRKSLSYRLFANPKKGWWGIGKVGSVAQVNC
jgi:hypothetical protein